MVLLQQLNAGGMTIILVTHENDIAAFASRVVTFRDGKVVSDVTQRHDPRLLNSSACSVTWGRRHERRTAAPKALVRRRARACSGRHGRAGMRSRSSADERGWCFASPSRRCG